MSESAKGCQSKHKAHRSRIKSGYYKNQYLVTSRNKVLRSLKRKRRAARWNNKVNAL